MPMIRMTTRSSIRVKPLSSDWIRARSFRSIVLDLLMGDFRVFRAYRLSER
jgi:hypothetical protein